MLRAHERLRFGCVATLLLTSCYLSHDDDSSNARQPAADGGSAGSGVAGRGRAGIDAAGIGIAGSAGSDGLAGTPVTSPACVMRELRPGTAFAPIDMVWVVDSSRSMMDEQQRIQASIGGFVSDIEANGFNVHLVMITATNIVPPPLGSDPTRYRFVEHAVQSHAPLQVLLETLSSYQDFLRPDAALDFVIVTDDESDLSADDFRTKMNAQLGRSYVVHAVASPDVDGKPCKSLTPSQECLDFGTMYPQLCGAAAIGRQYYALAATTGGEQISICEDDFADVFVPLTRAITRVDVPCSIDLGQVPVAEAKLTLLLPDGTVQPLVSVTDATQCTDAMHYLESGLDVITLCPDTCARANMTDAALRIDSECGSLH